MNNRLSIEMQYRVGEEEKVDKVRAGVALIADGLGLGDVTERTYTYPSGDALKTFMAG